MKSVYLDTCIVIYVVEKHHTFSAQIENLMKNSGKTEYLISPLTEMESMVMPLRTNDRKLLKLYRMFLNAQTFATMPREIYQNAAQLRADFPSLKTPDALHLATAQFHECDEFWTNDNRLDKVAPNLVKNVL